jgi:serine/threonine protein kinase
MGTESTSNAHPPMHPMIGKELGNYVLRAVLGEGGMGMVFRAEHKFLGDAVAIKVLHGTFANQPSVADRFFQEAKAARDIGHPSIVQIRDFGQSADGGLYLVMELLEGESLSAVLGRGRLSEAQAAAIGAAIAAGLAAAHKKGIVHRDLKPDNVFVRGDGEVKILDFGIAKVVGASGKTNTGALLGTPRYMAPEQARSGSQVGPRTDIYALGVMLFQMVVGRTPFEGADMVAILGQVLFEAPPRPSSLVPVSAAFEALVLRCMEKDPAARPASMDELRRELGPFMTSDAPAPLPIATSPAPVAGVAAAGPAQAPTDAPTIVSGVSEVPSLLAPPASSTTLSSHAGEVMASPGRPRSRMLIIGGVAAGITVLILGLGQVFLRSSASSPAAVIAPVPSAVPPPAAREPEPSPPVSPPSPPPSKEEAPSEIELRTQPPGATVLLGDREVGQTPLKLQLVLPQEVVVKLDGYEPVRRTLRGPADAEIVLERRPTAAAAPVARPVRRSNPPLAPSKANAKTKAKAKAAEDEVTLD